MPRVAVAAVAALAHSTSRTARVEPVWGSRALPQDSDVPQSDDEEYRPQSNVNLNCLVRRLSRLTARACAGNSQAGPETQAGGTKAEEAAGAISSIFEEATLSLPGLQSQGASRVFSSSPSRR